MPETITWDPKATVRFRRRHRLNKADFVRLLNRHGCPFVSDRVLRRWEGGNVPRAFNQDALAKALDSMERELGKAKNGRR